MFMSLDTVYVKLTCYPVVKTSIDSFGRVSASYMFYSLIDKEKDGYVNLYFYALSFYRA